MGRNKRSEKDRGRKEKGCVDVRAHKRYSGHAVVVIALVCKRLKMCSDKVARVEMAVCVFWNACVRVFL